MEAFESAGEWWLPENPDRRVVGLLTYTLDRGFGLQLPNGLLSDDLSAFGSDRNTRPLVHGRLRDGRCATLLDCISVNSTLHMPGTGHEELDAAQGFIGRDLVDADPLVDCAKVQFVHLRDWVVRHPSSATLPVTEAGFPLSADYHYQTLDEALLAECDDWKVTLGHTAKLSMPSVKGFHVDHECQITIDLVEPIAVSDLSERLLSPLWGFFTFCLDCGTSISNLEVRLSGEGQWLNVGAARASASKPDEIIMQPFMLLAMPAIGDRMSEVLCRWLAFRGDRRRAVSLLAGLVAEREMPVDLRFLAAMQALEALSRVDARQEELSKPEFERRRKEVLEAVSDKKLREWTGRKLEHANHRSAHEMLLDLTACIGEYADVLAPDRDAFYRDLRDNRNFYTHRDDTHAPHVLEGGDLYVLTQGVIGLLKASVLRQLSFSEQEVRDLMEECQGTLQWRFRVAAMYGKPAAECE